MAEGVEPAGGELAHGEVARGELGHAEVAHAVDDRALEAPRAVLGAGRPAAARPAGSPHSARFRIATALLAGVAVAAVLVAVAVGVTGHHSAPSAAWSSWAPPDGGVQGAREIAAHIAPLYRVDSTDQLAVVSVVNMASAAQTAASASGGSTSPSSGLEVAVQTDAGARGQQLSLLSGNTLAYNLCGVGSSNCSIGVGTASTARLLLRREALELALYSFKYLSNVDNVVAILPPGHTQQRSTLTPNPPSPSAGSGIKPLDIAVLFVRQELQPFLQQPLSSILPEEFPPAVDQTNSAPEAGLVEQITARGLFSERIAQAQDGSSLLELTQLPPQ